MKRSKTQIESLDQLIEVLRAGLGKQTERAADLVNRWFDESPGRYVEATLSARLGKHQEQFDLYRRLTVARQVQLLQGAVATCRAEQRSGLEAGSFMLGRFIGTAHPVAFWNRLADEEVAFLLSEWILHMRYLKVLDEVGERRIRRARQMILDQQLADIQLTPGDVRGFMSLKLSERDLKRVAELATQQNDAKTPDLLDLLRQPYGFFYDFEAPWSIGGLQRLCTAAGVPLPAPEEA